MVSKPVSVLYREPKLLKAGRRRRRYGRHAVSVLYREPKLLKERDNTLRLRAVVGFSALP